MRAIVCVLVLFLQVCAYAAAEERPGATVVEVAAGTLSFPGDGTAGEAFGGGAMRFYVTPRISVGPEITFVQGSRHTHWIGTGNLTWDIAPGPIVPFVVVGAGVFQTRQSFVRGTFTSYEPAFTAGGGIRAAVGRRFTVGAEARLGWESHVRANGFVSVKLFGD